MKFNPLFWRQTGKTQTTLNSIDTEQNLKLKEISNRLIKEFNIRREELTEKQLAETIIQIIKSGDLIKYIYFGGDKQQQAITYMPFRQEQKLKNQIEDLKSLVDAAYSYKLY